MFFQIFDDYAPLVKAINGTFSKIFNFLIIFFLFCFAFGDAYKVVAFSEEKTKDMDLGKNFFDTFRRAYLIALGEFQLDDQKSNISK